MFTRFAAAAVACLSVTACQPAFAQVPCLVGPPDMLEKLLAHSGEQALMEMQIGGGPESPTAPALFAVSPDGTFTLFMLTPTGAVCILASGTHAQPATGEGFPKPVLPGRDS